MKSRDFKVYVGYYEYNVYMDNEFLVSIGDPNEDLSQIRNKTELKHYCADTIEACIIEELKETQDISLELTKKEYKSLLNQFYNLYIRNCDFEMAKKLEVA